MSLITVFALPELHWRIPGVTGSRRGSGHWRTRVYNSDVLRTRAGMKTLQKRKEKNKPKRKKKPKKPKTPWAVYHIKEPQPCSSSRLETQTKNLSLSSETMRGFLENCGVFSAWRGGTFEFPPRAGFVSIKMHFRASLFVGFSVQAGEWNGDESIPVWLL